MATIETAKSPIEELMDDLVDSSKKIDDAYKGMETAFVTHSSVLQQVYDSLKMFVEAGNEVVDMAETESEELE